MTIIPLKHFISLCSILIMLTTSTYSAEENTSPPEQAVRVISNYDPQVYDDEITKLYQTLNATTHDTTSRVAKISEFFLGKPYLKYPLGEGPFAYFDKAPLYRTDGFDCQTYVETVLALAKASTLEQFKETINKIRYHNPQAISFMSRNHFVDLDWNLVNQNNGFVKDSTKDLGLRTDEATALINKPEWFKQLSSERIQLFNQPNARHQQELLADLHNLGQHQTPIESKISYIPLEELYTKKFGQWVPNKEAFNRIPDGAIIEVVRPNWALKDKIGTNLNVSHVGLAIKTPNGLMFREASSEKNQVVDIPLTDYLVTYLNQGEKSTVKGIHIEVPV